MRASNKCLSPVVRELGRDCAFTTAGADGRTRYKLRGRVFKGRRMPGDHAEWVVIEAVHQAVDAHQPFGVIARQYHHAKLVMFEGYAGTSASGFAAKIAAEENIATLDYLEDLYRDWDAGTRGVGGSAARIDAEFARVRAELGDLPGITADPPRLRAMLAHLTRTLHPGTLNDCFFNAATAACATAAGHARQPLPMLNTAGPVPAPQHAAITGYISDLTKLIDQINETDQEEQR